MNIAVFAIALFAGGVIGTLTQLYLGVVVSFLLWFVINIFGLFLL